MRLEETFEEIRNELGVIINKADKMADELDDLSSKLKATNSSASLLLQQFLKDVPSEEREGEG